MTAGGSSGIGPASLFAACCCWWSRQGLGPSNEIALDIRSSSRRAAWPRRRQVRLEGLPGPERPRPLPAPTTRSSSRSATRRRKRTH